MKKFISISFFLITCQGVIAQRPETVTWAAVQLPVIFSTHWHWHNDAGYRTLGTSPAALQYLYRTGIRYTFTKQWSAAAGVAFFFSRTSFAKTNDEFGYEFRWWQEGNFQKQFKEKLQWQVRLRAEQRFFEETKNKAPYTACRFRLRTALTQQLSPKWSLQLADEYMEQKTKQKISFDQNRLMASVIYRFNSFGQLQSGYMWLRWPQQEDQHILTISFTKNISLYGE